VIALRIKLSYDESVSLEQMIAANMFPVELLQDDLQKILWYVIYHFQHKLWKSNQLRFNKQKSFGLTMQEAYALRAWLNTFELKGEYEQAVRRSVFMSIDKKVS